jgi:pyruvate,water dikinase
MSAQPQAGFQSPFAVETPAGAEGWETLYPYYATFSEARRASEEDRFWFFDGMHNPEPIFPFDTIMTENWWVACNQMTTRVYGLPAVVGTGFATQRIATGQLIEVDGDQGVVRILEDATP